ncbi:MAG TPA: FtsQ-type POTRA domain-containing protein [Gaiellaceae bacterium]
MAARRRPTARAAALPARPPLELGRLAPSSRSVGLALALLALAVAGYVGARETSVFAVRRIEVAGGTPQVKAAVRAALAPELGRSLLRVDGDELDRRLAPLPAVLSARFDRAFPHTLRIVITPERPVLLLRSGDDGWVVSARGRVLRKVRSTRASPLPRLWVPRTTRVAIGATLAPEDGASAAAALAPVAGTHFPGHIRFVRVGPKELTFVLRSGLQVRLGDGGDLRLKLAVARRILAAVGTDVTVGYVDVSVPERPVLSSVQPQVEG